MNQARLWWTLWRAQWRDRPVRLLMPMLAIALGVALASAVYLVNRGALDEFERAARRLAGEADLVVRGAPAGFPESLYPAIARTPGVAVASPVLEVMVPGFRLFGYSGAQRPITEQPKTRHQVLLPVVAVDPFRATQVQPALLGEIAGNLRAFFRPDGIFLSVRAAGALGVGTGDQFDVLVGSSMRRLEVMGLLGESAYPRALGIMDIAAAQWMFDRSGIVNRIDVRVAEGADCDDVRAAIGRLLPSGVTVAAPAIDNERVASATRAYRVNLDMLALVAVLTGAFLVLATQALSILRRRTAFGLLRALGVTRGALRRALVLEGAALGIMGAALGVALGQRIGAWMLTALAGDLGAGQFAGVAGHLAPRPLEWVAFVVAGGLAAALASWWPAREAAARSPAAALKAGDAGIVLARVRPWRAGFALILLGAVLAVLPALHGLPLFGYGSIAALLLGGVLLVPGIADRVLGRMPTVRHTPTTLAIAQLRGSTAQASIGLAAIIVSFSLMVSMAIMVHSFRESFADWLDTILPADLQLRMGQGGDTGSLDAAAQARLARLDGVTRAEFRRTFALPLRRDATAVQIIAAPIDASTAASRLAIIESVAAGAQPARLPPAWISEAMVDLYGWSAGSTISLPLGRDQVAFRVAGIYRDYGRSTGSVVIPRSAYRAATGDASANDGAFWLARTATPAQVEAAIRAALDAGPALQLRTTTEVRQLSFANFDRAFAITYALEAIAVLIGLLGVSVTAASTALARRSEFGMLRHIGLLRRQVVAMLAGEGLLTSAIGIGCALVLGMALSLVLVYVVNRQSFLWSIDLAIPWWQLGVLAFALLAAAAVTATVSGRAALSGDALRAVREDW
ncbi:MAG: hypothetical protein CMLOHMNK_00631 [Steroidobacteraceae bacterium]|nr:hypothetical protein [Steroidobacteraceae bacterium]